MKKIIVFIFLCGILHSCASPKIREERAAKMADSVSQMIAQQNYVFHAAGVNSYLGTGPLSFPDYYTFSVHKDSVEAWLPYFGRGFTAPMNNTDGGIKFVSKKFSYNAALNKKKNLWNIKIIPHDLPQFQNTKDVQQIWMYIGFSGNATLQINSLNQTPISFQGYVSGK